MTRGIFAQAPEIAAKCLSQRTANRQPYDCKRASLTVVGDVAATRIRTTGILEIDSTNVYRC